MDWGIVRSAEAQGKSPLCFRYTIQQRLIRCVQVTPSRRGLRNQGKWLKPMKNLVPCSECGRTKMQHHLCPFCYPFNKWTTGKDGGVEREKDQ